MITPQDDAYLQGIAQELVDKFFMAASRQSDVPARSQIYGLRNVTRNNSTDVVLEKFIRHQIEKLEKKKESENGVLQKRDALSLKLWQTLEYQLTEGEFCQWIKKASYLSEELRRQHLDKGFSAFVTHFSCHYFYRLRKMDR